MLQMPRATTVVLPYVEQRGKQFRINALRLKKRPISQYAHRVMAMKALLMAGNYAEITNARIGFELLTK